jgi:hypothetical protein
LLRIGLGRLTVNHEPAICRIEKRDVLLVPSAAKVRMATFAENLEDHSQLVNRSRASPDTVIGTRRDRSFPRLIRAAALMTRLERSEPLDATVVIGVNFEDVYGPERHHPISNASCPTNCLAAVAKVLGATVGVRHGQMSTIHAYTADQNPLDGPHSDLRRARGADRSLTPANT